MEKSYFCIKKKFLDMTIKSNMTIKNVINGLLKSVRYINDWDIQKNVPCSPYVKFAYSFDRLGYGKVVLIDFRSCSFPYISSSITSKILQIVNHRPNIVDVEDIVNERQLDYLSLVIDSYLILLKKPFDYIDCSVLHFDISIDTNICKEMMHVSLTPCLFDDDKNITLALCMLTFSAKEKEGNVIVQLPKVDFHLEFTNGTWKHHDNSHLTNTEKLVLSLSANGKSINDIAKFLSVSIITIKTHRRNIFKKLGVKNISEAIQYVEVYNLI